MRFRSGDGLKFCGEFAHQSGFLFEELDRGGRTRRVTEERQDDASSWRRYPNVCSVWAL